MTMRDEFAIRMMAAYTPCMLQLYESPLSGVKEATDLRNIENIAAHAVQAADVLIAELGRSKNESQ